MAELACAQESSMETQDLRAKLDAQDVLISGHKIWCDNSLGVLRPLVPVSMQRLVFNRVHTAQPGPPWYICNQAHAYQQVCLDLVGPWPRTTEVHTHLLTVGNRTTRWVEAIPLQSITAQVVADSFVANWVAYFRGPATITTDQGTHFTGAT